MRKFTEQEKLLMYHEGKYLFTTPKVCHALWDRQDWINYIDLNGRWLPDSKIVRRTTT